MLPSSISDLRFMTADPAVARSVRWGAIGAGMFLGGMIVGVTMDDLAIGVALASFVIVTPLLVFAGLLYNFRGNSESALPRFKALLIIMLVGWASVELFALGAFAFAWSDIARWAFLLIGSVIVAFLIFAQFVAPQIVGSARAFDDGGTPHDP
jgi:hypothetical protein